jgi:nitric oxide reductase NorQ protein
MTTVKSTQAQIIEEYLGSGKKGASFTDNTSARKKGVITKFLTFCRENGYDLEGRDRTATVALGKDAGKEVAIPLTTDLSKVRVLPVSFSDFMREDIPRFVETRKEFKRMKVHLKSGIPLLLRGPKGIGKTLFVEKFCEKNKIPLPRMDCSENTKIYDLMGKFLMIGDETVFQLGIIPTAIEVANQKGQAVLDFEELGSLTPAMQKVLNQLLDYRKACFIPGLNKHYSLKEGVQLLVVGTTNPSTYGAVHELNEDLASRFAILDMKYPNEKKEKRILNTTDIDEQLVNNLVVLAKETRAATLKGEIEYALSTRDLDQFFTSVRAYNEEGMNGTKYALEESVFGKYESDQHKKWLQQRIDSIFETNPNPDEEDEAEDSEVDES